MPINAKVGLREVMDAADEYFRRSGRRVTFEYVMLRGVNDGLGEARALADLLEARKAHANLIPYNPVPGLPLRAALGRGRSGGSKGSSRPEGLSVSVRKTKGREIDAACGQLRRRAEGGSNGAGARPACRWSAPR